MEYDLPWYLLQRGDNKTQLFSLNDYPFIQNNQTLFIKKKHLMQNKKNRNINKYNSLN